MRLQVHTSHLKITQHILKYVSLASFFKKEKLGPNLVENITNLITKLRYLVNSRVTLSFLYIETSVDVQIERSRLDGGQKLIFAVEMEMYILVIIKRIYTHEYIF